MALTISVLAERPDLVDALWGMENTWPEFMRHDPIGGLFYRNVEERFADYVLVGQDDAGEVVAAAYSIPFVLDGDDLPDNGWDGVIRSGVLASISGDQPNAVSAVEIACSASSGCPDGNRARALHASLSAMESLPSMRSA